MELLTTAGIALAACGLYGWVTNRIKSSTVSGLYAVSNSLFTIKNIHEGDFLWAVIGGAATAASIYLWWNNGGGDDTKRRLKSAAEKFQPTRRTAPDGGAA